MANMLKYLSNTYSLVNKCVRVCVGLSKVSVQKFVCVFMCECMFI